MLNEQQVAFFEENGFLVLERFVDEKLLDSLRRSYDAILDHQIEAPGDRLLGGLTRQVMNVWRDDPLFEHNEAVEQACRMTEQLLGVARAARVFDMLIYKPPGHPHETPWHQDLSYYVRPVAPAGMVSPRAGIQFWIALDDVDEENGCMEFVPGVHRGPLFEHRIASGDPDDEGRLLAMTDPATDLDLSTVVVGAIPAGGCTLHRETTPHYTPPNRSSSRPRRAYIFTVSATEPVP